MRLIELGKESEVYKLEGHQGAITALAVSPDGRRAVTGSEDRTVRLWDLEKGRELLCLEGHEATVRAVALYSGDKYEEDKIFSASWNGKMRFWSATTGQVLRRFDKGKGRFDDIIAAAFHPFGMQVVTVSNNGNLRIWKVNAEEPLEPDKISPRGIGLDTFSREGHYYAHADRDYQLALHKVGPPYIVWYRLAGHEGKVTGLAFSNDSRFLLSGSHDRTVRLWSVEEGGSPVWMSKDVARIEQVAFSTDGKHFLAVNATGTVSVWDTPLWAIEKD